jgi:nitrate/nitrite-specific signal transduction histidine kinase
MASIDITEKERLTQELKSARDELEIRVEKRTRELDCKNQELMFLNHNLNNILRTLLMVWP